MKEESSESIANMLSELSSCIDTQGVRGLKRREMT